MQATDVESMMALLEDEHLRDLLRRSARECISWEEFLRMSLPAGASAVDTWELLGALRRAGAVYFPIPDIEDWDYWYTQTYELTTTLSEIEGLCREGSRLHRAMTSSSGRRYVVRAKIEESVAASQLDGMEVSPQQIRDLLRLDRAPRTANERVIRNTVALVDRMSDYVDEPFSNDLLDNLVEGVLEGVDPEDLTMTERRGGFGQEQFREQRLLDKRERQRQLILGYANEFTGDPYDHPITRALIVRESIRGYRLAEPVSGSVARLVFDLYMLKKGLPVLTLAPISKTALAWEAQEVTLPRYNGRTTTYPYSRFNEYDITPFLTIATGITLKAVEELKSQVEQGTQRDEELRDLLQENVELNHRQRSILGRALRNPESEFTIRYHKTNHNVAYATARADLIELADAGYLTQEVRGKAFVFVPVPDLKARLGA